MKHRSWLLRLFFPALTCLLLLCQTARAQGTFSPANPGASGYVKVFDDEFPSLSSIDVNATGNSGYNWYTIRPYGYGIVPADNFAIDNGLLTISPQKTSDATNSWSMATAYVTSGTSYVGSVFGGGFYVEASIAITNPTGISSSANGWPAFWSYAMEHLLDTDGPAVSPAQWPGEPSGYLHLIEDDFFEYNPNWSGNDDTYFATMHDWSGPYYDSVNFSNTNSTIYTSSDPATDWTEFHTIGQLWVPGNASNNYVGYVQNYFDGVATSDKVQWVDQGSGTPSDLGNGGEPGGGNGFTFSIMDQDHVAIILGTGVGVPLQVQWVHVWQTTGAPNVRSAVSRRTHGAGGNFDLPVSVNTGTTALPGNAPVECRSGTSVTLVVNFDRTVTGGSATCISGKATVGSPTFNGNTMTIPLTGVTNAQTVQIQLTNIVAQDVGTLASAVVSFRELIGDVDGDGTVSALDMAHVRNDYGVTSGQASFNPRENPTCTGVISALDMAIERNDYGLHTP
jgi:hypothetical protein